MSSQGHRSMASSRRASVFLLSAPVLLLALLSDCESGFAQDGHTRQQGYVTVVVPLKEGKYYFERDFLKAVQAKLGGTTRPEDVPNTRHEWTSKQQRFYRAKEKFYQLTGVTVFTRVRKEKNQLIFQFPDTENDTIRRKQRQQIGRQLGVDLLAWPPRFGLKRPPQFQPGRPSVVLIHGIEAEDADLEPLESACKRQGRQVLKFIYPNDGPINWSGKKLSQDLKSLAREHPGFRCQVIAHSMGGLVTRYCLEKPEHYPGRIVTDLVTLGTPHRGSGLYGGQRYLELLYQIINKVHPKTDRRWAAYYVDGLGEAAEDLKPDSRFLRELNKLQRPGNVEYHSAAGHRGFLSDDVVREVKRVLQKRAGAQKWPPPETPHLPPPAGIR